MRSVRLISKNKYFILGLILMAFAVFTQSEYRLDKRIQDAFYYSEIRGWIISESNPIFKFTFYTFPKIIIISTSILMIICCYMRRDSLKVKRILAFLFCMILIPLITSLLKVSTGIHCPYDLLDYNGSVPFRSLLDFHSYSYFLANYGNGNCFPGGHASGGFALMSSCFILPKCYRRWGIFIGLMAGALMGCYQMLKGAHFFSHILFTLGFAVLIISGVQTVLFTKKNVKKLIP